MSNKTNTAEGEKNDNNCPNSTCESIKILFLDIDGVMNGWDDAREDSSKILKSECLERLKQIIDHTHCKIVLSTARRACAVSKHSIEKELIGAGIAWNDIYIGDTPLLRMETSQEQQRLDEIATYLKQIALNPKYTVDAWVAVDDLSLNTADEERHILKGRFVQTDGRIGISDMDVTEVINTLRYYNSECVIL